MLEPIFEADFEPVSYGFRPKRRAQDAIAEIHLYGTQNYRWVLDADIGLYATERGSRPLIGVARIVFQSTPQCSSRRSR